LCTGLRVRFLPFGERYAPTRLDFGSKVTRRARSADPYRDLDVIDERAPRVNQTFVGVVSLAGVLTGQWWLMTLVAAQLAVGLAFGRRYCLPCLAYYELIQPRFGEGPLEDARPPRFANQMGVGVLGAATVAHVAGSHTAGNVLGVLVAALALLSATTGFCTGCQIYRIGARLRGLGHGQFTRVDPSDLAAPLEANTVVEFTHPLCAECHSLARRLRDEGRQVLTIDVRERPDLARKYGVGLVPTAVTVDGSGAVLARLA
jgi:hypothetical protein